MDFLLDPVEVRVLGCLIEKDITTPEYYPLTLNALVNACNQKSNRDPVVAWEEHLVAEAVDTLRDRKLAGVLTGGGNRVPKYSHRIQEALNLGRREIALLCELLLRGPQTTNELRERGGRMYKFSDAEEVESCLARMQDHAGGPLLTQIPRQPGQKEGRFAHLLAGEPQLDVSAGETVPARSAAGLESRVSDLEIEVRELRRITEELRRELGIA
ncbi:MAG: YceH family protein [Bryobacteraceae bacterium]|nr:YceH family protein [Bryobacteraceae bacterium]